MTEKKASKNLYNKSKTLIKKILIVSTCFSCAYLLFFSINLTSHIVLHLGQKLWVIAESNHKVDGVFDEEEISRIEYLVENKVITKESNIAGDTLRTYAGDIHKFIRKYVISDWKGIDGLSLHIAARANLEKAWNICSDRTTQQKYTPIVAFYCPYNNSITIREDDFETSVETYDHEEGHHINDLDGDTREFTSEFNRLWKGLIRQAMNPTVGFSLIPSYFSYTHIYGEKRTIQDIGLYTAGSLMFFMVMNYFKGDLVKPAEFIFNNGEKELEEFFYRQLKKYPKKYSTGKIWYMEYIDFINNPKILENIKKLRKKSREIIE